MPGFCGEGVEVDEDGGSREGFEAVDHGRRKRGERKVIGSWSILEEKFQECNMREGVGLATSVETLGVDLSTRTKQLRANEKAGRQ